MPLSSVLGAQSLVRPGVCTSTTRPAVPFEGQTIYETDTDSVRSWDGTNWVVIGPSTGSWTSFTPTWLNVTVGNGTINAAYTVLGKTCTFYTVFTLGSTSSVGDIYMHFPVAPRDVNAARGMTFTGTFNDVSVRLYPLMLDQANTSSTVFRVCLLGTNNGISGILYFSASNSIAWASGDVLYMGGTYGIA
jgi:hypothetical protein